MILVVEQFLKLESDKLYNFKESFQFSSHTPFSVSIWSCNVVELAISIATAVGLLKSVILYFVIVSEYDIEVKKFVVTAILLIFLLSNEMV